jgi:hypothetical protein
MCVDYALVGYLSTQQMPIRALGQTDEQTDRQTDEDHSYINPPMRRGINITCVCNNAKAANNCIFYFFVSMQG